MRSVRRRIDARPGKPQHRRGNIGYGRIAKLGRHQHHVPRGTHRNLWRLWSVQHIENGLRRLLVWSLLRDSRRADYGQNDGYEEGLFERSEERRVGKEGRW